MVMTRFVKIAVVGVFLAASVAGARGTKAQEPAPPSTEIPACDGGSAVRVEGVAPGERMDRAKAQRVADFLMASWLQRQDPVTAAAWVREREAAQKQEQEQTQTATEPKGVLSSPLPNEQPVDISPRDTRIWEREVAREVAFGDQVFHDDKLIGSTNGFACAMCHPNASNTHPETYPKFQTQLRKTALLRDMINWCIENPVRGKPLDADDPKMRALEAYILAQRKGVSLEYGKH